jgi:hypothetical protein
LNIHYLGVVGTFVEFVGFADRAVEVDFARRLVGRYSFFMTSLVPSDYK